MSMLSKSNEKLKELYDYLTKTNERKNMLRIALFSLFVISVAAIFAGLAVVLFAANVFTIVGGLIVGAIMAATAYALYPVAKNITLSFLNDAFVEPYQAIVSLFKKMTNLISKIFSPVKNFINDLMLITKESDSFKKDKKLLNETDTNIDNTVELLSSSDVENNTMETKNVTDSSNTIESVKVDDENKQKSLFNIWGYDVEIPAIRKLMNKYDEQMKKLPMYKAWATLLVIIIIGVPVLTLMLVLGLYIPVFIAALPSIIAVLKGVAMVAAVTIGLAVAYTLVRAVLKNIIKLPEHFKFSGRQIIEINFQMALAFVWAIYAIVSTIYTGIAALFSWKSVKDYIKNVKENPKNYSRITKALVEKRFYREALDLFKSYDKYGEELDKQIEENNNQLSKVTEDLGHQKVSLLEKNKQKNYLINEIEELKVEVSEEELNNHKLKLKNDEKNVSDFESEKKQLEFEKAYYAIYFKIEDNENELNNLTLKNNELESSGNSLIENKNKVELGDRDVNLIGSTEEIKTLEDEIDSLTSMIENQENAVKFLLESMEDEQIKNEKMKNKEEKSNNNNAGFFSYMYETIGELTSSLVDAYNNESSDFEKNLIEQEKILNDLEEKLSEKEFMLKNLKDDLANKFIEKSNETLKNESKEHRELGEKIKTKFEEIESLRTDLKNLQNDKAPRDMDRDYYKNIDQKIMEINKDLSEARFDLAQSEYNERQLIEKQNKLESKKTQLKKCANEISKINDEIEKDKKQIDECDRESEKLNKFVENKSMSNFFWKEATGSEIENSKINVKIKR